MAKSLEITTGQYVKIKYIEAKFESRFWALLIDILIFFVIGSIIFLGGLYLNVSIWDENFSFIYTILCVSLPLMNLLIEYFSHGQTIGKMALRIMVVSDDAEPPKFYQCFLRWILFPIDLLGFGLAFAAANGQRIGDRAAGCRIVYTAKKSYVNVDLVRDYKFAAPDYVPRFTRDDVAQMTDHDEEMVTKAMYDIDYDSITKAVAERISKRINLKIPTDINCKDFLLQLHNDYLYYKCH